MLNYCANGPSGYNLTNSLRFRSSASASLTRTFGTPTSGTTWTMSFWFKRGVLGVGQELFAKGNTSTQPWTFFYIDGNGALNLYEYSTSGTSPNFNLATNAVFRDPSSWYHIVVAVDTTQATAANRQKVYVNGVQQTFSSASYYPQNTVTQWNSSGGTSYIGRQGGGDYLDGYLTEINFIDGQALTPSSFGSTNSTTGVWQPAKYTGTYGTNGFYLPFNKNSLGFSSYYGNFNGSNQSLSVANNTALNPETNDYCVEAFMYSTSLNVTALFDFGGNSGSIQLYFESGRATFRSNGSDIIDVPFNAPNQWVHIAVTRSGSSVRLFVNGIQQGSTVSNSDNLTSTQVKYIGRLNGGYYFNGRISNFRFVKGSAVYTSNFTVPTSALTAITNTQLLTLQNSTIIDNSTNAFSITNNNSVTTTSAIVGDVALITSDQSGNNNNWNPNNINYSTVGTTYDSMTDVPTLTSATVANYAVLNPTIANTTNLINANLTRNGAVRTNVASMVCTNGKYYFETTIQDSNGNGGVGVKQTTAYPLEGADTTKGATYFANGEYKIEGGAQTSGFSTYTNGDVIGIAIDTTLSTPKIWFAKNNTWQGTGDPTTAGYSLTSGLDYYFAILHTSSASSTTASANFGQRPFAYTPPTGFVALNTYNLPTSTIVQGNKYMDATVYTGNGTSITVTNAAGFKPDLVWAKNRTNAGQDNGLYDSIRGVGRTLYSNLTNAESGVISTLTAFNSNGFSGGTENMINQNGASFVGWQWQAGQGTTSSNTNGSITSTVSVNASAGFSIVTYTGTGANATVGHGLGVAPKMIIFKGRSTTFDWMVYHTSLGNTNYLRLNQTNASAASISAFNNTSPTSNVFSLGDGSLGNQASNTQVAYCWAEIAGFSKFDSYTGNGSSDGPFVYLGFRPKYVMIKLSSVAGENWYLLDSARNTYNPEDKWLIANGSGAEGTVTFVDFLSNGFKVRSGSNYVNYPSQTFIFAAFAENPFKNALAR